MKEENVKGRAVVKFGIDILSQLFSGKAKIITRFPKDMEVTRFYTEDDKQRIVLVIESSEFEKIPECGEIPEKMITFSTMNDLI